MPMMYVPAELAVKVTVVISPDCVNVGAGFSAVQLNVNTLLPEAVEKNVLKLPVVMFWSIVKVLLPAVAVTLIQ